MEGKVDPDQDQQHGERMWPRRVVLRLPERIEARDIQAGAGQSEGAPDAAAAERQPSAGPADRGRDAALAQVQGDRAGVERSTRFFVPGRPQS
jgi:hypothetical protein